MTASDPKDDLHHYLQSAREALVWKLDGLKEYDLRRPLTPTGTNLLGLVKHLSGVELLYLGTAFDRHFEAPPVWFGQDMEPNADMWATDGDSREHVVDTYRQAWAHSDATIEALDLDAVGYVPWLSGARMTLRRILVHLLAETERHAGHADVVRELIDRAVGRHPGDDQMAPGADGQMTPRDQQWWDTHRNKIEQAARQASQR